MAKSLKNTLTQESQGLPATPSLNPANVGNFESVLRNISRDAYTKQAKTDVKNSALGGIDPSSISGSAFEKVMGNLESMRGGDITKEYAAGVQGYTDTLNYIQKQQEDLQSNQKDMLSTIMSAKNNGYDLSELGITSEGVSAVGLDPIGLGLPMRTDRNNNPAAFTVDIARQAGLIEGVDYTVGDKFPGSSPLYTAKLLGDPMATTIKVIDAIGFNTQSGQQRWTYTSSILGANNKDWSTMTYDQKANVIKQMYAHEGGNGSLLKQDVTGLGDKNKMDLEVYKQKRQLYINSQLAKSTSNVTTVDEFNKAKDEYDKMFGNLLSTNDRKTEGISLDQTEIAQNKDYQQYGLLAESQSFNPQVKLDQQAKQYLDYYIKNATIPTYYSLFGRSGSTGGTNFSAIQERAQQLFYESTGMSLPDVTVLKSNKGLIGANNKLLNNLNIQEGTINRNFKLAIDNLDKNSINQESQPINQWINSIQNMLGDPNVAQYLTQNQTLANEAGNLIALKNAQGTTVSDKLMAAGLVPKDASEDQQKSILKILMQEAENGRIAIQGTTSDLYKQIDPLETELDNPNRINKIGGNPNPDQNASQSSMGGGGSWDDFNNWQQTTATQTDNKPWWQKLWESL